MCARIVYACICTLMHAYAHTFAQVYHIFDRHTGSVRRHDSGFHCVFGHRVWAVTCVHMHVRSYTHACVHAHTHTHTYTYTPRRHVTQTVRRYLRASDI